MPAFEVEVSGCIEAPPETAWALLSDRSAVPLWLDDVAQVTGDGTELLVHRPPGLGAERIEATIREAVPLERLELALTAPSPLLRRADVALELGPGDGGTAYRLRVACEPRPLWSVLSPLLRLRTQIVLHRAVRGFRAGVAERIAADRRRQRRRAAPAARERSGSENLPLAS